MNVYQCVYLVVMLVVSGYFSFRLGKDFEESLYLGTVKFMTMVMFAASLTVFMSVSIVFGVDTALWIWDFLGSIN